MSYRLLVTDMDGTLLDRRHEVASANAESIRRLQAGAGLFTLATGRIEASVRRFVETLQIRIPVILYNGARVVDLAADRALYERHLGPAAVLDALAVLRELPVDVNLYADGRTFVREITPAVLEHLRKDRVEAYPVGDLAEFFRTRCPGPVTKLLIIGHEASFQEFRRRYRPQDGSRPHVVSSDPIYLEVLPPGVSKGKALVHLCAHLGVPPADVVAVGDSPNDIEMLEAAGLGVAVANSHPDVLAVADYVAPPSDDGAVAHVIERFFSSPPGRSRPSLGEPGGRSGSGRGAVYT